MVRDQPLIDRLERWVKRFDPVERTFGDFRRDMERENAAFFALLRAENASTYLLDWWEYLYDIADRSGYLIETQTLYGDDDEELEPTEDWYIRAEDRYRLGNERILPDPNQLPLF
jgi:hypothetical protein